MLDLDLSCCNKMQPRKVMFRVACSYSSSSSEDSILVACFVDDFVDEIFFVDDFVVGLQKRYLCTCLKTNGLVLTLKFGPAQK